uniref:Ig-like domain-containing protein n=1 Tax=Monodelphis domestica TaxID=13616 RepID=A0A5F8G8Z4_MONDO
MSAGQSTVTQTQSVLQGWERVQEGPLMTLSILNVSPDILGVRANLHLTLWPPSLPGLPKPVLFAEPSSVVAPGTNVTLGCSALELTSQELLFTLSKAGSPGYPHPKKTGSEARFSLPSVKVRDAGSYSCFYSERRPAKGKSETSETLDLVVTGSLPRPSLQALPSAKVSLNGRVTLRCVRPVKPSLGSVMFMWLKAGTPEPLGRALQQSQRWANFTLPSVTVQDAGSFRCVYYEKTVQPRASEPSEPLYVCVTGEKGTRLQTPS